MYAGVILTLGSLALLAVVLAVGLGVSLLTPGGRAGLRGALRGLERHPIAWAWAIAAIAMAGSLYFSEGVGFVPCSLCWYQRIAMYPLVLVLGVGAVRGDVGVWRFALPLPLAGLMISAYHVVVQHRPTMELVPCGSGPPCSGRYLAVFGFVTIPVMAGAAFMLIAALLFTIRAVGQPDERLEAKEITVDLPPTRGKS